MLKVFLAAAILVGAGVFAMCFNIIFLKKDFPNSDVGTNEEMKKKGIRCMKESEGELWGGRDSARSKTSCSGNFSDACSSCSFYEFDKGKPKESKI